MRGRIGLFGLAALALAGVACGVGAENGDPAPGTEREVLVAHFTSECVGVGPQVCLNVREPGDSAWTLRYDPIEGFEYEPGYDYRLRILETPVSDPPADGSSLRWTLIEEIEKTAAAAAEGTGILFRSWRLSAFGPEADLGADVDAAVVRETLAALPADGPVTLDLSEEGRASGFDGCNRYFGDLSVENGHEVVQGPKGATLMACPDGQMKLEQAFLRNLESVSRAFVRDGVLEMRGEAGVILLFEAGD